jgi:hypothetical protein
MGAKFVVYPFVPGSWFLVRASRVGYRQVLASVTPWSARLLFGTGDHDHDAPTARTRNQEPGTRLKDHPPAGQVMGT